MAMHEDKILKELKEIIQYLDKGYDKLRLDEALDKRNVYLGRLTFLSAHIDEKYFRVKAELLDENPKIASWKLELKLENMPTGRLFRLKKQITDTIILQCRNLTSLMIEVQSERKNR